MNPMLDSRKRWREQNRAKGLCVRCGNQARQRAYCEGCRKKDKAKQVARYAAYKAIGICIKCGYERGESHTVRCPACEAKHNERGR